MLSQPTPLWEVLLGELSWKFEAWNFFREPGKYKTLSVRLLTMPLRSWRLTGHKWRERVSRGGSVREKPTALQSGSALTASQGYLFVCIPLLPLKSLCADHGVCGAVRGVGAGSRSPPRHGGSRGELAMGCHLPMPHWEKDDTKGGFGAGAKGAHRCPARPQGFCSCCCHSAAPQAHGALASIGGRNAQ